MSDGNLAARRKNWTGGEMDAKGVDEEFRSLRRALGQNFDSTNALLTSVLAAPVITIGNVSVFSAERALTGTSGQVTVTDNGANSTAVLSIPDPFNSPGVVNVPNTKLKIGGVVSLPILQIVTATTATSTSTSSTTYVTTNLSASITPSFNSSKILVLVAGAMSASAGGGGIAYLTIFRGSTDLAATNGGFALVGNNNSGAPMIVYDSPATTSSTTYSARLRSNGGSNAIFPTTDGGTLTASANMILVEIAQ